MNLMNQVILVTDALGLSGKALLQFMFLLFGENGQHPLIVNDKR